MKKLFLEHRGSAYGAKRLALSNKESFLRTAFHIFVKRGLITEEVSLKIPLIRKKEMRHFVASPFFFYSLASRNAGVTAVLQKVNCFFR